MKSLLFDGLFGPLRPWKKDVFPVKYDGIENIPAPILRQYPDISRKLSQWITDKGYCENLRNNEEMARSIGIDRRAMNSYFRNVIHEDCRTWRIRLKIEEACRLIRTADFRFMREIADRTGFSDQSNFSKQFERHTGQKPYDWMLTHEGSVGED